MKNKRNTFFLTTKSAKHFKILHKRLALFSLIVFTLQYKNLMMDLKEAVQYTKYIQQDWRENSVAKCTCCSCRHPKFSSSSHMGPAPGDSFGLLDTGIYVNKPTETHIQIHNLRWSNLLLSIYSWRWCHFAYFLWKLIDLATGNQVRRMVTITTQFQAFIRVFALGPFVGDREQSFVMPCLALFFSNNIKLA